MSKNNTNTPPVMASVPFDTTVAATMSELAIDLVDVCRTINNPEVVSMSLRLGIRGPLVITVWDYERSVQLEDALISIVDKAGKDAGYQGENPNLHVYMQRIRELEAQLEALTQAHGAEA